MPKGYLVANIKVTDAEKFQTFSGMAAPAIEKYNGKVLARGPLVDRHEGKLTGTVMRASKLQKHFTSVLNIKLQKLYAKHVQTLI
jgi:uncharacterized protein (DUF1330 family)